MITQTSSPRRISASSVSVAAGTYGLHPDARDWAARVTTNGGSVSAATLSAVSTFCAAISAAGIRDRFYRLNLFCGNSDSSLNAVRTPLYRGPTLTGTQLGNATDTNNSFVAADYSEGTGLKGNGSTKFLNTGLTASTLPDSKSRHLAFYMNELPSSGDQNGFMGAVTTDSFYIEARATPWVILRNFTSGTSISSTSGTTYLKTLVIGENIPNGSNMDSRIHFGTTIAGQSNNSASVGGTINANMFVFAVNASGAANQSNARCAMYSIGLDIGGSLARAAFVAAVNTFMTAMGRA